MDVSLSFGQPSQIPLNVLQKKTKRELVALIGYCDACPLNADLMAFLSPYGIKTSSDMTTVTRDTIDKALSFHAAGLNFYWSNAETVVHAKGGSLTHKPSSVVLEMPNLKPQTFSTESGYPVENPRPYLAGILAFISSTCCIRDGKLKYVYQQGAFAEIFPDNKAAFDVKGMKFLAATVESVFKKDHTYQKWAAEATSIGGARFWHYLAEILNMCDHLDYIAIHNVMCTRVLYMIDIIANPPAKAATKGAFTLGARMTRNKDGVEERIITNKTVAQWPAESKLPAEWHKAVRLATKIYGHPPFLLVGSIPDGHAWFVPKKDSGYGEIEAISAYTKRRDIGSGGSNGPGVILQCNGFSSVASYTSNRCVMLMVMARNAMLAGRELIDVVCTRSEMAYLERGLPLILGEKFHNFIRYVLEKKDFNQVGIELRALCSIVPRENAHVVAWHDVDVDSVVRGQDVHTTFDTQWKRISTLYPRDSTVMLPILSRSAFSSESGRNVFIFRSPADFQAIYSTLGEFSLFTEDLKPQPLKRVTSYSAWLQMVVGANSKYVTWFLCPKPMYSPMSNLIRSVAKGVAMNFRDGEAEPVMYVPPVPTVKLPKRKHHEKKPYHEDDESKENVIEDLMGSLLGGPVDPTPTSTPPSEMGYPPNRLEGLIQTTNDLQLMAAGGEPEKGENDQEETDQYGEDNPTPPSDGNGFEEASLV